MFMVLKPMSLLANRKRIDTVEYGKLLVRLSPLRSVYVIIIEYLRGEESFLFAD